MKLRNAIAAALLASFAGLTFAADHRDGPLALGDPSADLNDVYLFNNPNDASEVILILTFHPDAPRNARFSDAVEYRNHFDNGATGGRTTVTCTFPDGGNSVNCSGLDGALSVSGPIETTNQNGDIRVFAGLRDDPFFFDAGAFNRTRMDVAPRFTDPGVNTFAGFNTLTIAMGIKHARLTNAGANPVLKVYSSSNRIGDFGVTPGHTGTWFDPANPGHGLIVHTVPAGATGPNSPRQMIGYWSVFDNSGAQLSLFGVGDIDGFNVSMPVVSTSGGGFPPASSGSATTTPFGTLNIGFNNCNTATMDVVPTRAGFSPVTVDLSRVTAQEDLPCSSLSPGQIDRNGRPAINTALINVLGPANGLKDVYNRADDIDAWADQFQAEMESNLGALDTLDGVVGNWLFTPTFLASVLVDDRLIINTSIAQCGAYLAVEQSSTVACGGRTIDRDVIDDSFGAIVGPGVSDNVPFDDVVLPNFPFISPPQ